MKRSFFQAAVVSILLYGCTTWMLTWMLTKRLEKKLDGNYTRMLRAILNKSWRQHPTRHQLYGQHTFSSYVRIQDVVLKTFHRRWTIGRSGERGSEVSVLAARHDDDDNDYNVHIKNKSGRGNSIYIHEDFRIIYGIITHIYKTYFQCVLMV